MTPKGLGAIVMSISQLYPPYNYSDELVLEIIRLKSQSILLYGDFDLDPIPMPSRKAIIEDAKVFEILNNYLTDNEYNIDENKLTYY